MRKRKKRNLKRLAAVILSLSLFATDGSFVRAAQSGPAEGYAAEPSGGTEEETRQEDGSENTSSIDQSESGSTKESSESGTGTGEDPGSTEGGSGSTDESSESGTGTEEGSGSSDGSADSGNDTGEDSG